VGDRSGPERDAAYARDIVDSCQAVEGYVRGKTLIDFERDAMLQDAIARRLFVIGEAAKNLSSTFTAAIPSIDWKNIARLRDKLGHHYWAIEVDKVWEIVVNHLRPLREALEAGASPSRRR
jgi:uncharacterized protein with HEPN domain